MKADQIARTILLDCKPNYDYIEDLEDKEYLADYWTTPAGRLKLQIELGLQTDFYRQIKVMNTDSRFSHKICLLVRKIEWIE